MTKLKLGEEEIELDPKHLEFNEITLNDFLKKSHAWYAYYTEKCQLAQRIHTFCEDKYEEVFARKFKECKDNGGSDKYCENAARCDPEVVKALERTRISKYNLTMLNGYLRSLDKAMDNAINLGYNIRKELDKLGTTIKASDMSYAQEVKTIEDIMGIK